MTSRLKSSAGRSANVSYSVYPSLESFLSESMTSDKMERTEHKKMASHSIPLTCYRLQFNQDFTFLKATEILDYLTRLGITTIYSSPLLQSRTGSEHGYDVTDPTRIDSDLGSEQQFEMFQLDLHKREMGLLLDVVPNHMAASPENPWWMDVLENGPGSSYASYFDIDWHPPSRIFENKILLPVLGGFYADILKKRELQLVFKDGSFSVQYYESSFPLAPKSYRNILIHRQQVLEDKLGAKSPAFQEYLGIIVGLDALAPRQTLPVYAAGERRLQVAALKERLKELHDTDKVFREFLTGNIAYFNGVTNNDESFRALDRLLSDQSFALSYWNSANAEINYRRFFNVAELVGVRVEDPAVLQATHSTIFRLIESGAVTGLRIDHIDGLRDPLGYLQRLQSHVGAAATHTKESRDLYIIVEKILSGPEHIPTEWPVSGTTGYDFLNAVNRIFVYPGGLRTIERMYAKFLDKRQDYKDLLYEKKKLIMTSLLAVEMRYLGHQLATLGQQDRYAREIPAAELAHAFAETTVCLSVYRTYIRGMEVPTDAKAHIEAAIAEARSRNPRIDPKCFSFVYDVLLGNDPGEVIPEQKEARLAFVMRWQQLTGAITAKGFEDTLLYVYFPLLSLNDVGGDPRAADSSAVRFEDFIEKRSQHWPHALNSTATHDTKRGEDVRARIDVLSEIPAEWSRRLIRWNKWNAKKRGVVKGQPAPDRNEEIFIYQTLLGAWPLDENELRTFEKRLREYMTKAVREAKVHTRWIRPNLEHEKHLEEFVAAIIKPGHRNLFLQDFLRFHKTIAYFGMLNGLSQALIKMTAPGVPEIYQGCELWDFRLVDPDNRRPVDYSRRAKFLAEIEKQSQSPDKVRQLAEELMGNWHDGRVKLYLTWKILNFRRHNAALFLDGTFEPLKVTGRRASNVVAYARHHGKQWTIIVAPKWLAHARAPMEQQTMPKFWADTEIVVPKSFPSHCENILTSESLPIRRFRGRGLIRVAEVTANFPVACLGSGTQTKNP
jgi:(1->4)-alpha-D-glucan 1-alpha-D-glucosylmutase